MNARAATEAGPAAAAAAAVPVSRPRGRVGRMRPAYYAALVVLLGPIVTVLVLRLPLINQLNYADAWFYSGYAWAPKHEFAVFGWNYFSVRFPAILAIGVFQRAFGTTAGYVLLRYLLAVACGWSLYLCARRFARTRVALIGVVLLYLNPFFVRMLLWDYSGFMEVAAGLTGVTLWYWSDGRRPLWSVVPGVAFACAVFANALIGTALIALLAVEALAAARGGMAQVFIFAKRLVAMALAAVGVFVVGYLSYLEILGSLSPQELVRPTIKFLEESEQQSSLYVQPVSAWLFHEPRIWAPIIVSVALAAVMRRRILGRDIPARVAQLCVGYTAVLWAYRFLFTSSVIETWWAYSIVVVAMAPGIALLAEELAHGSRTSRRWGLVAVGAAVLAVVLIRLGPGHAGRMYKTLGTHEALLAALVAAALVCAVVVGLGRTRVRGPLLAALAVGLGVMLYAPSVLDGRGTTGIFVTSGSEEWKAYPAGKKLIDVIEQYDNPSHRVFLWYSGLLGYVSMAWVDLPQTADTLNEVGASEGLATVPQLARARLQQPNVDYVMVLAPKSAELSLARAALGSAGFPSKVVRIGELVGSGLDYELLAVARG